MMEASKLIARPGPSQSLVRYPCSIHNQKDAGVPAMKTRRFVPALLAAILFSGSLASLPAQSDSGFGPLDPAPPTGLTADQVIEKFAARESVFDDALQSYGFREDVRFQTLNESNKVDGEYHQTTDISYDS